MTCGKTKKRRIRDCNEVGAGPVENKFCNYLGSHYELLSCELVPCPSEQAIKLIC